MEIEIEKFKGRELTSNEREVLWKCETDKVSNIVRQLVDTKNIVSERTTNWEPYTDKVLEELGVTGRLGALLKMNVSGTVEIGKKCEYCGFVNIINLERCSSCGAPLNENL